MGVGGAWSHPDTRHGTTRPPGLTGALRVGGSMVSPGDRRAGEPWWLWFGDVRADLERDVWAWWVGEVWVDRDLLVGDVWADLE